jgi:hypothetical protein
MPTLAAEFLAAARAMPTLAAEFLAAARAMPTLAAEEDSKSTAASSALDYGVSHG